MAAPKWITIDDHEATTGNGYVTITCEGGYKGRVERTGHVTVTVLKQNNETDSEDKDFIQLPMPEYVAFDQARYDVTEAGGQVTITGKTNAPRLGFAISNDAKSICTLPNYFSIQPEGELSPTGNQDVEGQVFYGDPGASVEIVFSIVVTIAANETIAGRDCTIVATGSEGVSESTAIVQEAKESYIDVTNNHLATTEVVFGANTLCNGEKYVVVDVYSNDNWRMVNYDNANWFIFDADGDLSGDGHVKVDSVASLTGRVGRSSTIYLDTYNSAEASIVVSQTAAPLKLVIDHIEDEGGNVVSGIGAFGGVFYIVCYSNAEGVAVEETGLNTYTDINDSEGLAATVGMTLIEKKGVGNAHNGVALGAAIENDYGASAEYMFKIPFTVEENETASALTIAVSVGDLDTIATDSVEITQSASEI